MSLLLRSILIPSLATACLVCVLGMLPCVAAAQPVALANYVPQDAGFFVEVDNLPAAFQRYQQGPLHDRLTSFSAWSEWLSSESQALHQMSEGLAGLFGVTWDELSGGVLGGKIAFVLWPQPAISGGSPAQTGGALLLIEARDARSLRRVAEGFRELHSQAGMAWREDLYNGVPLHVGLPPEENPDSQPYVLATVGRLGILCDSKDIAVRVLDLATAEPGQSSRATLYATEQFQAALHSVPLGADGFAFLNPPPWLPLLQSAIDGRNAAAENPADQDEEKRIRLTLDLWRALRFTAASLRIGDELELSIVEQFDDTRLPEHAGALLASASGTSRILENIPADCLAAVALRVDLTQFPGWLSEGTPQPSEVVALLDQIAASLGPEFGAHLAAVEEDSQANASDDEVAAGEQPFPLAWVFEMRLRNRLASAEMPDVQTFLRGAMPHIMNFAFRVTSSSLYSNMHAVVEQGIRLSSLQEWTLFAAGENTTFGYRDGYALASTSAAAVEQFARRETVLSLAQDPRIRQLFERPVLGGAPNQVLFLNCRGLREFLLARHEEIAAAIETARDVSRADALLAVDQMIDVLQLADYVSISGRVTPDRVAISVLISADAN